MTPPRAVVEAVRDAKPCAMHTHNVADRCGGCATETASAVLAAHYAGEVEGRYKVKRSPSGLEYHVYPSGMSVGWGFRGTTRSEPEARRVAHALNWEPIP